MLAFLEILLGSLAFFSIGLICLAWPERVQHTAIEFYLRHRKLARFAPFWQWVRTPYYRLQLRIIGILAILCSLLLLFVMLGRVIR
jgi:hypothetical protein